jgi:hypothetical protein
LDSHIIISPLPWWTHVLDWMMTPVMYLIQFLSIGILLWSVLIGMFCTYALVDGVGVKPVLGMSSASVFPRVWIGILSLWFVISIPVLHSPQETHRWNNQKLSLENMKYLRIDYMVEMGGDPHATPVRWWQLPLFHLGGWKKFVVLKPTNLGSEEWYVGWNSEKQSGVSQIPLNNMVRMLVGNDAVRFFGITKNGAQIPLTVVGHGILGQPSLWKHVTLR